MAFDMPPIQTTAQGALRRVGFELEFSGVQPPEVAALLVERFGGHVVQVNRFLYHVDEARHGRWEVSLDVSLLKEEAYARYLRAVGIHLDDRDVRGHLEGLLARVAASIAPYEVVSPPLGLDDLGAIDDVAASLRRLGARGTRRSVLYAFGLHINPEAPSMEPASLLTYLRAFLLLYPWLREAGHIDLTRRASHFIRDFPAPYYRLVMDPDYRPDLAGLIEDYLRYNSSRNRPLDLLPVFSAADPDRVRGRVSRPDLVKSRPAYHYRLPNSQVSDRRWSVAQEWNRWVRVERLAGDGPRLRGMMHAWGRHAARRLDGWGDGWAREVERWI